MNQKEILKSLVMLSIPTMIEQILSTLLQYVDTAMVGHLGEQATASVSTTTTITWLVNSIPHALGIAFLAMISKECGAGHKDRTRRLAGQAMTISLVVGSVLMVVCVLLSSQIPQWMHAEEAIWETAGTYFAMISLAMVFRSMNTIFAAALRAVKDTKTPMFINLGANGLNILLNYLFIYRMNFGVIGAAIGSAISYSIFGGWMVLAARKHEFLTFGRDDLKLEKRSMEKVLHIGIPALSTSTASCLGYVFFASMVSGMGTTIFAAHSIAVTAEQLFYVPGHGLRQATSSLVGNSIGENNPKKQHLVEHLSILITIGIMFLTGLCLFLVALPLMKVFTSQEDVAVIGAAMLRLVAFTEPFFGLMIVMEGIAYGTGRTMEVFLIETCSMWGIRIVFTYLVTNVWMLGLTQVWYCMIADNIVKALGLSFCYLYHYRKEKKGEVLEV